jgi:hypothetical protein
MLFDIDRIIELKAELRRYNSMDLSTCQMIKGGHPYTLSDEALREWLYTGLNNCDIVDFLDEVK